MSERPLQHSARDRDEELIDALAANAAPVRPLPRVRTGVVLAIAAFALVFVGSGTASRVRSDLLAAAAGRLDFTAAAVGLALCAIAAAVAALAGVVPGRERDSARARRLAALALAGAAACAFAPLALSGFARTGDLAAHAACIRIGLALAFAPAFALALCTLRGFAAAPASAAASALAAAGAMGALGVHLVCRLDGALHVLVGHLATPVLAAIALAAPLAFLLRRFAR